MVRMNNLSLFSGLFFVLITALLFVIQKLSPLLGHAAYYCQSFVNTYIIHIPFYISIIPFSLLFLFLTISFIKFFVVGCKTQFLKYKLGKNIIIQGSIQNLINQLGLEKNTAIVQSGKRFAFCLGVREGRIYISTGLIAKLSKKELEAVLRHEQYHLEHYDTVTLIIASVVHSLFPYFPLLSDLIKTYRIDREIKADKFAAEKVGDTYPLISALKKLLAVPEAPAFSYAAFGEADTLEPRICSLINKKFKYGQFSLRNLCVTFLSAFVLGIIVVIPVHAKEIHHNNYDVMMLCSDGGECMASCTSTENMNKLYSEMPKKSSDQNASYPPNTP